MNAILDYAIDEFKKYENIRHCELTLNVIGIYGKSKVYFAAIYVLIGHIMFPDDLVEDARRVLYYLCNDTLDRFKEHLDDWNSRDSIEMKSDLEAALDCIDAAESATDDAMLKRGYKLQKDTIEQARDALESVSRE